MNLNKLTSSLNNLSGVLDELMNEIPLEIEKIDNENQKKFLKNALGDAKSGKLDTEGFMKKVKSFKS